MNNLPAPLASLFCVSALVLGAAVAHAQPTESDSLLRALLHEQRRTLALEDGRISGPGADFLLEEGRRAHFFMVGEEHGVADVPEFTAALFRALRPHGYEHLAIETSPSTAALLERHARSGRDSLASLYRRHPVAVPFYSWHEEADLLVSALEGAGPEPVLWGVDYEFILGAALALTELERRAPTAEARALARRYRDRAEAGERAVARGDMSDLFFVQANPDDYAALRAAFAGDATSVSLLDVLEASAEVWRLQFAGDNYRSNLARTDLMRVAFAEAYRQSMGEREQGPKALLKFGANHLFRGRTPVNVLDVGTMAAMLAEYDGGGTFNVMVVAGSGAEQAYFHPTNPGTKPVEIAEWATPLYEAADAERWTVIDLRPLRPLLHSSQLELEPKLERLVWSYDAFLVLTGSRAAGFDPIPTAE